MINYEEYIKSFKKLDYEGKRKKLLGMLDILAGKESVFDDIQGLIKNLNIINEGFLDTIFYIIANIMYSFEKSQIEKSKNNLDRLKTKLRRLQEQESKEKEKESIEADNLLDKI
ncbi:hypothetical protein [Candidatus Absconditicoccus praedator]|uniref:hypothetical protein n=1 Tax=Candidatus Absconditicoccus praedator TaxID=2735562 RepID=UPI001E40599A|nr:hypothetical protein [Candidatus Absconditicoccus praedator]UFX82660.1 hypothetical protein HLG78_00720 [Candidatus Absconditicoccus praedator]